MKILNEQEFEQVAFNHLSGTDFEDVMNFYKKSTAKPHHYVVIDTTDCMFLSCRVRV